MNLRKLAIFSFVALFLFAGLVSAEWQSLSDSRGPAELEVKVLSSDDSKVKVEVVIPGYHQVVIPVGDEKCLYLRVPGAQDLHEATFPVLPMLGKLIKIHDHANVKLEIAEVEEVEVKLPLRIVPSKGHLTRDINPENVPFVFGKIYETDVFWPKEAFKLGDPFLFRDLRGVHLCVVPFRPNHVQMTMKVIKRFVAVLHFEGVSVENTITRNRGDFPDSAFTKIYEDAFVNYTEPAYTRDFPSESVKNLVLVYADQFKTNLHNSAWYARRSGQYAITELNLGQIGSTKEAIKAELQRLYDNVATRPAYIILFGDADTMPTWKGKFESADSDRLYVRLAGNDNIPDAYISRFSGSAGEIKTQLDKVVAYENEPAGAWLKSALLIASQEGSPTDQVRMGWIINGGGDSLYTVHTGGLKGFGYTTLSEFYRNGGGDQDKVAAAINSGVSVMCYIGHGTNTSWYSTGFSTSHINSLTNGNKLGVVWSVACVNGNFAGVGNCFAEAWLRKAGGGAVSVEASTTNEAWVPPCVKQAGTINSMLKGTAKTVGAQEAAGVMAAFSAYGTADKGSANQLAEQCHIFGDCTMVVRHANSN